MTGNITLRIQTTLGLGINQLERLVVRAPYAYKMYTIPKKSGGVREIAQPAKETKLLQRWLVDNVFCDLPVHAQATAYKTGASIKLNAQAHAKSDFLSKFDFYSFFPSISETDVAAHLREMLGEKLTADEIKWISRVSCIRQKDSSKLGLSVGAPSSPILSNSIMFEFDCIMVDWCESNKVIYTRYADDLAFSSNVKNKFKAIEPVIHEALGRLRYPTLLLNAKKTIHVSKKNQRRVTGLIINNEGILSLGRERKRIISSKIHKFSLGILDEPMIYALQGLLGLAVDVEPSFISSMRLKYGNNLLDSIFSKRMPQDDIEISVKLDL